MNKAKIIIAACILIAGFFGYFIGKANIPTPSPVNNTQVNLLDEQIKVTGIDNTKQKQIEDFLDKFYEYQYEREIDKLLALFTPPANKQEQDSLDSLLGKDYAAGDEKPLPRLFNTQGYSFRVPARYIRTMTAQNSTITVLVDEMRVMYSGMEYVGYTAQVSKLTLDLVDSNNGLQLESYYHNNEQGKYEGFSAY